MTTSTGSEASRLSYLHRDRHNRRVSGWSWRDTAYRCWSRADSRRGLVSSPHSLRGTPSHRWA